MPALPKRVAERLTDPVLGMIYRDLRRVSPDVRFESEQIKAVLESEVIKREVVEGERADDARRKIARAANKPLRSSVLKDSKHAEWRILRRGIRQRLTRHQTAEVSNNESGLTYV